MFQKSSTFICFLLFFIINQVHGQNKANFKNGILGLTDSNTFSKKLYDTIISKIGDKTIIGLGEGTHGTAEFNAFRSELSKNLIKDKEFNFVCFENNYGGTYFLDKALKEESIDIYKLVRENFIGIYHTPEITEFLRWLSALKKKNNDQVTLVGMDYAETTPALKAMELSMAEPSKYRKELDSLMEFCLYQDKSMRRGFDRELWLKNGMLGYAIIKKMRSDPRLLKNDEFQFAMSSLNIKIGFEIIYHYKTTGKDLSRDSAMAQMVNVIKEFHPKSKIVIWAHNAHISKKSIFGDTNGGGEGEFLLKLFPSNYMAIGTLTSLGSYSVTKDRFPTKSNYFLNDRLSKPPIDALESYFDKAGYKAAIIDPLTALEQKKQYPMRFSGFQKREKRMNDFVNIIPSDCFDLLIYMRTTTASRHF